MAHQLVLLLFGGTVAGVFVDDTVKTRGGLVRGRVTEYAREFRGIPYAESERWGEPSAAAVWNGTLDALADGPGCPQNCAGHLPPLGCPPKTDESCLFLNVFTPLGATPTSKLPVLLFLHGGQFNEGFGGGPLYDGTAFVQKGVILVSINYRLGVLGMLFRSDDKGSKITGNYAIKDQLVAIQWARENVAAFGGDPERITLMGQSAGSQSVANHMHRDAPAKGQFSRALLESEPYGIPFRTKSEARTLSDAFVLESGCVRLTESEVQECLAKLSVEKILKVQLKIEQNILTDLKDPLQVFEGWVPTVGTVEVPENPMDSWSSGRVQPIPTLAGSMHDEGVLFVHEGFAKPLPKIEYEAMLLFIYGAKHASEVSKRYPGGSDSRNALINVAVDALFTCPNRYNARMAAKNQSIYVYQMDQYMSFAKGFWADVEPECYKAACHAGDLPFVFKPNLTAYNYSYTSDELTFIDAVQSYWANFAATGNPNMPSLPDGVPQWPNVVAQSKSFNLMNLTAPTPSLTDDPFKDNCDFFDSIGYHFK